MIVAARHLHLAPDEARAFGVKDGEAVSLRVEGQRAATLENVIVRSGEGHRMEAHIDKDEANACGLADGQLCRVLREGALSEACAGSPALPAQPAAPKKETMLDLSKEPRRLITEDDVRAAAGDGYKIIRHAGDAIITPLARDTAYEKRVELVPVF